MEYEFIDLGSNDYISKHYLSSALEFIRLTWGANGFLYPHTLYAAKKQPSKIIPTLLALNGGLIVVGGLIMIGVTSGSQFDAIRLNRAIEASIILGIAALQIILAVKSNKIPPLANYR